VPRKGALWTLVGVATSVLLVATNTQAGSPIDRQGEDDHEVFERMEEAEKRFPTPSQEVMAQWDAIREAERKRWTLLLPGGQQLMPMRRRVVFDSKVGEVSAQPWVNIGPSNALFEYNGNNFVQFDSGRPNAILVDPRDANVVYLATAMGGLWKSYDFLSGEPTWHPAGDTLTNLSIGAAALDPNHPDTLYVATGDSIEQVTGGTIVRSDNGAGTWSTPITLLADLDLGAGVKKYRPNRVRDIRVAPNDSNTVLVATSLGLFRSSDAGKTFAYVDLPNGSHTLAEGTWTLAYLGGTSWAVSGVTACDEKQAPYNTYTLPPGKLGCKLGAIGDIWRSTDGGATWTSIRNTPGAWPAPDEGGRISLAAGKPKADPTQTVLYAQVGNEDITNSKQLGFWRSLDGGQTWKDMGGTVANPTTGTQCVDLNIAHGQAWYNQAIAVDPDNDDHVIAGGNLCSVRTLNGTAAMPVWENVSHWLPFGPEGATNAGPLPYAHADWHTITTAKIKGQTLVFAGNDGGIYSSSNVFDAGTVPTKVTWTGHNRGLATHLIYNVGSGDPAWGNGLVALSGLQDNGTFIRANAATPTTFLGVLGGDGVGSVINKGSVGEFYWVSNPGYHAFCMVEEGGCKSSSPYSYWYVDPVLTDPNDSAPFYTPYSAILTDPTGGNAPTGFGVLTATDFFVWQTDLPKKPDGTYADPYDCNLSTGVCQLNWKAISQNFNQQNSNTVTTPVAARKIPNLYGAVLNPADGTPVASFAVTKDGGATPWNVTAPLPGGLGQASSMDFPMTSTTPGQDFIVASNSPTLPASGHVYKTTDGGQTWTPIGGIGGTSPLPNLPVWVIKYDPMDANTIYVGTLIGVYFTKDGGATWARLGSGLPFVEVRDIYVASNQDFIRIATYGRGLWEIYPAADAPAGVHGDGDYDRNLQLDWVDVAAVASRLGTTPGTTTPPMYSYICDLNGATDSNGAPVNAVDDGDLTSILGKFGDHP